MKSKLRNFRNESSFTRTKSPDPDLQTIPVSERQQIAMIRQMSNKSSRGRRFIISFIDRKMLGAV